MFFKVTLWGGGEAISWHFLQTPYQLMLNVLLPTMLHYKTTMYPQKDKGRKNNNIDACLHIIC
jgi:hypothetical protein